MNLLTKFSVGQYVHGNRSWLRIIDSRLKIIIVMIFLITPIWAGPIWRLSLVGFLLLITFLSLLPSRVWWRSLFFLSFLSILIGCISILASSDLQSLDSYLRSPNELEVLGLMSSGYPIPLSPKYIAKRLSPILCTETWTSPSCPSVMPYLRALVIVSLIISPKGITVSMLSLWSSMSRSTLTLLLLPFTERTR